MEETFDRILTMLSDGDYSIEEEHSIENDGIGSYEYWGSKEFDAGVDYVEGTCTFVFNMLNPNPKELTELITECREEFLEKAAFFGSDAEVDDLNWNHKDGKVRIDIYYTSTPPDRREYCDY